MSIKTNLLPIAYLKGSVTWLILLILILVSISTKGEILQPGIDFFQQGKFAQAIEYWQTVRNKSQLPPNQYIDVLIRLTTAYQAIGNHAEAHAVLQKAQQMAENKGTVAQQVLIQSHLGDMLLTTQRPDEAETLLKESLALARTLDNPSVLAHLLNNLGNALYTLQFYLEALEAYAEVTTLAERSGDIKLQIQSLSNQASSHLKLDDPESSLATLNTALPLVQGSPDNFDKAKIRLS